MKHDLNRARKCVEMLDQRRLERALLGSGDGFQQVLSLLPLLFQLNHPSLPGYVVKAPCGVAHFSLSDYQQRFLKGEYPAHYDSLRCFQTAILYGRTADFRFVRNGQFRFD